MKIAFFSNYLNHHQLPLCKALYKLCDGDFRFVACTPINPARIPLGYSDMNNLPFVIRAYEDVLQCDEAIKWCMESDAIIHGSAWEKFAAMRIEMGLPVFRYSERIFRNGIIHAFSPRTIKNICSKHTKYRNNPVYMLCASAFTSKDFALMGAYKNKAYRWGYFPEVTDYLDITTLINSKKKNSILWVARLIELKHPEAAIEVAKRLKNDGYDFSLDIIGNGPMEKQLQQMVSEKGLSDCVKLLGSMQPEKVREHMEKSEIFLFTSDRKEGWGAVLNESMNSACAVVASHAIGSVPFLIKDGENGLIYKDGNIDDLYKKVKFLLDNPAKREQMGLSAYRTLTEQWNAENAAKRFVELVQSVIAGNNKPDVFADGVCSKAPILKENWYKG